MAASLKKRLIPILLIENGRLVKTKSFSAPRYLGDPLNALRIFNEKCADEIMIIDKSAAGSINYSLLDRMVGEAFMPISYIGGVRKIEDFRDIFNLGIEKVGVNQLLFSDRATVELASARWGQSSVFGFLDVKEVSGRYHVAVRGKSSLLPLKEALELIKNIQLGEIVIQNIDREGTSRGLDARPLEMIMDYFTIPIISSGGARSVEGALSHITKLGISGVAAGSMFSFYGKRRSVLITYNYSDG